MNPLGLRSGWRLLIWMAIVIVLQMAIGRALRELHLLGNHAFLDPTGSLESDVLMILAPVMCATLCMARIERRRLADYYLPGRDLFGRNFWVGTLWGLAAVSLLIGLIAAGGGYRITGAWMPTTGFRRPGRDAGLMGPARVNAPRRSSRGSVYESSVC